jgi:hypothetical protein
MEGWKHDFRLSCIDASFGVRAFAFARFDVHSYTSLCESGVTSVCAYMHWQGERGSRREGMLPGAGWGYRPLGRSPTRSCLSLLWLQGSGVESERGGVKAQWRVRVFACGRNGEFACSHAPGRGGAMEGSRVRVCPVVFVSPLDLGFRVHVFLITFQSSFVCLSLSPTRWYHRLTARR